ncbi:unnamed protein product [Brassica rapa]|uniref:Uncharacterized protein n=2 Tax=Brassica TaxID=3705 RepID=A0A3P5YWB2_BRACM|nr:unnamed protein product [Brassica napus]CAG7875620.1 unnamed protein product [Brassica rapa]CDY29322.1 BnaA05g15890D [Brassica napus]VDC71219.1 unnamed protein product [Brassica rapa]
MLETLHVAHLFFFHILFIKKGVSTYDYIVALREQEQELEEGGGDPYYSLMKAEKRECDWLYAVVDANYGIPTKCACGQPIGVETDLELVVFNLQVLLTVQDDGLHFRICCLQAIEHELTMLKNDARDEAINRTKLESKIAQIILELAEIKKSANG